MKVFIVGGATESLAEALSNAHIAYTQRNPAPGVVLNASPVIEIAQAVPWAAAAAVWVAWLRGRASRKIIVTMKDQTIVHAEGLSVEEFEKLLPHAKNVSAVDTAKDHGSEPSRA